MKSMLEINPGLEAKTLFDDLQRRQTGSLDTLQRRVKHWRAINDPPKEIFFAQFLGRAILIEILTHTIFIANKRGPKTEQAKLADLDTPSLVFVLCTFIGEAEIAGDNLTFSISLYQQYLEKTLDLRSPSVSEYLNVS